MQKVYDILFINTKGEYDSTQLNAEDEVELDQLIALMREELEIEDIVEINEVGSVQFSVCALGYDVDDKATDYDRIYGYFDTYEEAYREFVKLQSKGESEFFNEPLYGSTHIVLRVEEGDHTDDGFECFDVHNETDFYKN